MGFTMVEVLLGTLLLVVIFLAVSALHVGGRRFFLIGKDRVVVGYEIQYALEHIYKHIFAGTGDIDLASDLVFGLDYSYEEGVLPKTCRYRITGAGALEFDEDYDGVTFDVDESLGSKVTFLTGLDPVTGERLSKFSMHGNLFRIKLTAEFPLSRAADGSKQDLTLYAASYPRCATFQ